MDNNIVDKVHTIYRQSLSVIHSALSFFEFLDESLVARTPLKMTAFFCDVKRSL